MVDGRVVLVLVAVGRWSVVGGGWWCMPVRGGWTVGRRRRVGGPAAPDVDASFPAKSSVVRSRFPPNHCHV